MPLPKRDHAQKRAIERVGVPLTNTLDDIKNGRFVFLDHVHGKRIVVAILLDGKAVPVIYDKGIKKIITVLPRKTMLKYLTNALIKMGEAKINPLVK